ncbi:unnamed protein product [Alopecurus aequalis]
MSEASIHQFQAAAIVRDASLPTSEAIVGDSCHGTRKIIRVSRVVLLEELVKSLKGGMPAQKCTKADDGYFSHMKVVVPDCHNSEKMIEMFSSSKKYFGTELEAIDEAAAELISVLQKYYMFDIDDINWKLRSDYQDEKIYLEECLKNLKEENDELKEQVNTILSGWAYSLEFAHSVYDMSTAICLSVYAGFGQIRNTESANHTMFDALLLNKHAKFALSEGRNAMRRILRRRA